MPILSTSPNCARLAFTLELTGWDNYPMDAHGQFMTGRSPEERATAPFRKYSGECMQYRLALEMLDQRPSCKVTAPCTADYDWPWLLEDMERLVDGEENKLHFEPIEPGFRLRIELVPESRWESVEEELPAPEGPRGDNLFDIYTVIDLEQAARRSGYGGEVPAAHLVLERAELPHFLEQLQAEYTALD